MLMLVTAHSPKSGRSRRRPALGGRRPPRLQEVTVGGFPALLLTLRGKRQRQSDSLLTPYRTRGDVLVFDRRLEEQLQKNSLLIEEYARRLCVNLAIDTLQCAPPTVTALLIDRGGECVGVAAELLRVCNTLWVAARQPEDYLPCAAYTRERYGNSPLFVEDILPSADFVVAPYGMEGWSYNGGQVYGPNGIFPSLQELYLLPEATLPEFHPAALTAGIFAAFHPRELMTALPVECPAPEKKTKSPKENLPPSGLG